MISYNGGINTVDLSSFEGDFEEAPWLYKRDSTYYLAYAGHCYSEDLRYSTAPGPTGPWTYRSQLMPTPGTSFTNHPGIIDYKGGSYLFYQNGALPGGGGFTRSVAVEKFEYGSDGSIPRLDMTEELMCGRLPRVRCQAARRGSRFCFSTLWAAGIRICLTLTGGSLKGSEFD
jgi:hypothetical protein